jgi:hypothetical protein
MKQVRISNSPLLDPAFCTLVLVSPEGLEPTLVNPKTHATCKRAIELLLRATEIAEVPVFLLAHDPKQTSSPYGALSVPSELRFGLTQHRSPWAHKPFVEALATRDRTSLILAGLWLDHEILAVALNALVDGYDVYVLLDGSAHRSHLASVAARERLTQAGGTLVTTAQVIGEWACETADTAVRAALTALARSWWT